MFLAAVLLSALAQSAPFDLPTGQAALQRPGQALDARLMSDLGVPGIDPDRLHVLIDDTGPPTSPPSNRNIFREWRKSSRDLLRLKGRKFVVTRENGADSDVIRFSPKGEFEDAEIRAGAMAFRLVPAGTLKPERSPREHLAAGAVTVGKGVAVTGGLILLVGAAAVLNGLDDDDDCPRCVRCRRERGFVRPAGW